MLPDHEVVALTDIFKVMGDATRLKILQALARYELCVCDLAALLEATASNISHQLRLLRNLKLVRFRRKGKIVYYSLDDEHVEKLLAQGLAHIRHQG